MTPQPLDASASFEAPRPLGSSDPRTLSLCMIVKNEEDTIARALQSIKPVVDEIIVVDTGSTDRTKEIARSLGAKVYDFAWTDSFSDARNFSISKATGDWILILDADEVIAEQDLEKLRELVTPSKPHASFDKLRMTEDKSETNVMVSLSNHDPMAKGIQHASPRTLEPSNPVAFSFITRNYIDELKVGITPNDGTYREESGSGWIPGEKVRLFPNDNRFCFENPVHELVEPTLSRFGAEIRKSHIPIHHYGKLNKQKKIAKGNNYYQLGKLKLHQKGGKDIAALYELASQAAELGHYEEALVHWKKLVSVQPAFSLAFYGLGTAYFAMGKYNEAISAFKQVLHLDPSMKDAIVMRSTCEICIGKASSAIPRLEALLRDNPNHKLAAVTLAMAYICSGEKEKGLEQVKTLDAMHFEYADHFINFAKLLITADNFDYAIQLLEAAVETGDTTAEARRLLDEIQKESKRQDSRIRGFEDSSGIQKEKLSPPGTLSLCMIVKNEEDTVARALQSIQSVVDEIIVVDTGSTDRTKVIAQSLGAKVYDFAWTDSFSDARNFSISKATGGWILILDADEVISPLDHDKLRGLVALEKPPLTTINSPLEKGDKGGCISESKGKCRTQPPTPPLLRGNPSEQKKAVAYSFVTRTYVSQMNTAGWTANDGQYKDEEVGTGWFPGEKVRLFPNDSRIRFEYPLHERVEPSVIQAGGAIKNSDIPIHHYGNFVKKEKARSKVEQYYQLGEKKIAEQQNFMAFYELALLGAELGKHDETIEYLKKTIALNPDFSKAYQSMGNAYYNLGRYREALSSYKKALELNPDPRDTRDALLMWSTCEILTGNAEKAVTLVEDLLRNDPTYPQGMIVITEAYICAGSKEKGRENVKKLMALHFDCGRLFDTFAKMLISAGRNKYALSLLEAAVEGGFATDETQRLLEDPSTSSG